VSQRQIDRNEADGKMQVVDSRDKVKNIESNISYS